VFQVRTCRYSSRLQPPDQLSELTLHGFTLGGWMTLSTTHGAVRCELTQVGRETRPKQHQISSGQRDEVLLFKVHPPKIRPALS
jgi:hypothetical protein